MLKGMLAMAQLTRERINVEGDVGDGLVYQRQSKC